MESPFNTSYSPTFPFDYPSFSLFTASMTTLNTPKYNNYGATFGWILLAFYMLIANILLLNLLIAVFG